MRCTSDLLSIIEANNICYIYEWKYLTYWGAGLQMVGTLSNIFEHFEYDYLLFIINLLKQLP